MKKKTLIILFANILALNLILAAAGYLIYDKALTEKKEEVQNGLKLEMEYLAESISLWHQSITAQALLASENYHEEFIGEYLREPYQTKEIIEWLGTVKECFTAQRASLYSEKEVRLQNDYSLDYDSFIKQKGDLKYFITEPFVEAGKIYFDAAAVIESEIKNKSYKGYLFTRINLSNVIKSFTDTVKYENYNAVYHLSLTVNKKSYLYKPSTGTVINLDSAAAVNKPALDAYKNCYIKEGVFEGENCENTAVAGATVKLADKYWFVSAEVTKAEISSAVKSMFVKMGFIVLAADILTIIIVFIAVKRKKNKKVPEPAEVNLAAIPQPEDERLTDPVLVNKETGSEEEIKEEVKKPERMGPAYYYSLYPENKIIAAFDKIQRLGYIPKILFEVNQAIKKEPDNQAKLAGIISRDISLTSKILSVSNSVQYGLQRKVTTIEHAVMILGREELKRLVTAISLSDAVRFPSSNRLKYMDYWKHSMLAGNTCRDLAVKLGFNDQAGDAFMAGIFHDLGVPVLAKYFPKEYDSILVQMSKGCSCIEAETEILGLTHQQVGAYAAFRWELPDLIINSLENHHNPAKGNDNLVPAALINLADWMIMKISPESCVWEEGGALDPKTGEILGLNDDEKLEQFFESYKQVLVTSFINIKL